jgi:outer membrane protein TolC
MKFLVRTVLWAALMSCGLGSAIGAELPVTVSLKEAMQATLDRHPNMGMSSAAIDEARALLQEVEAGLYPRVQLSGSEARLTTNLLAQGFPANSRLFPSRLGPFNSLDLRLTLTQSLFDMGLKRRTEASAEMLQAREHAAQVVRDQLLTWVAMTYIGARQAHAHVEARKAELTLSERLLELVRDQKKAGLATGVDIARSEHRVVQDRYALTASEAQYEERLIHLKRLMGTPMSMPVTLSTDWRTPALTGVDEQIATALQSREELKMLEAEIKSAEARRSAADAERYPTIGLQASAGASGVTPTEGVYGTGLVAIGISVPIVTGGDIEARKSRAQSQKESLRWQKEEVTHQIEEDVRVAERERIAAVSLKESATSGWRLAERLYQLAEDRFKAGVADTLEVVDAATQMTLARSEEIDADARAMTAMVNSLAATGQINAWRLQ